MLLKSFSPRLIRMPPLPPHCIAAPFHQCRRFYHKSTVPTLYCAATPIGNLRDISVNLREHLTEVQYLFAENTLSALRLLQALDIPHRDKKILQYAEDKSGKVFSRTILHKLVKLMQQGNDALYLSEAGSPCISDPGHHLVDLAHEKGIRVSVVAGPSSPIAALMMSGFDANRFIFHGFLDKKPKRRRTAIQELHSLRHYTVVLFENSTRLRSLLSDLSQVYHPDTRVAICREITKRNEEVIRGKLKMMNHLVPENVDLRGEIVVVVEGSKQHL